MSIAQEYELKLTVVYLENDKPSVETARYLMKLHLRNFPPDFQQEVEEKSEQKSIQYITTYENMFKK